MGIVTNALLALINKQLDDHQVVVWFDPEKAYSAAAAALAQPGALPKISFAAYDPKQGFLALRRSLEPLWRSAERPRLLIYVPLASKDTHNALAEYLVSGVRLEPGQPGRHNTRLAIIARHALENVLPATVLENMLVDVESGKLSLTEIEALAERGQDSLMGVLSLIFQSASVKDIALHFLTQQEVDRELAAKLAGPVLAHLLNESLAVNLGKGDDLASLRSALNRHLLTVEFIQSLAGSIPSALKTIPLPASLAARQTAVNIVRAWRQRRDRSASYIVAAQKLEAELGLGALEWDISTLRSSETFQRTESVLQTLLEQALVEKAAPDLLDQAQQRLSNFWAIENPEIKLRWQVILDAAQVMLYAQSLRLALKSEQTAGAMFKRYTAEDGWYKLDTFQRHLERDAHNFDAEPQAGDSHLKLVAAAQRAYAESAHLLADRFVRAYQAAGFSLAGVPQQVEIYHDFVEPAGVDGPVAYFLVDAFRYEMARELVAQFPEEWKADLTAALATPPTITEVGMAALMPWAERGISIIPAGTSKLGVMVAEMLLKGRPERVKLLGEKGIKPLVVTELNKIAPLKDKSLRSEIKAAGLVVVTATDEIDGLWENQPHTARRLHEDVFEQLRRGMRTLFGAGFSRIVIAADHGFLMGDRLLLGEALDPPGGDTADLHRRMWVGKGGAAIEACMRKPLSAFGIGGDLELVTPYGLSCFKVAGGSNEYFHGGLSLQEMTVPVISVTPGKAKQGAGTPAFKWSIKPGSQKITTRFFTVSVEAQSDDLFASPPRLRAELRAGSQVISVPVAASYGFNEITRDVSMKFDESTPGKLSTNAITLQITDIPDTESASLYLLDEFGASLCPEINLPLAIMF